MSRFLVSIAAAALCLQALPAPAEEVLLLPYFDSNGENGVFLAWSADGVSFSPVNERRPIFKPPQWRGQNLTRDPSIIWHDGRFHMVWTSHWTGRWFGYASSPDLKDWSKPQQVQPFPDGEEQPKNIWAPEIFHDHIAGDFKIVWSSTLPSELSDDDHSVDSHGHDHRMYYTATKDFRSFSPPEPITVDRDKSVIDAYVAWDQQGERWVMVYKNEYPIADGGKNLVLAFSPPKISPRSFTSTTEPIVGPGAPIAPEAMVEGPSLVRWQDRWLLYWDSYILRHYAMASSTDLEQWQDHTRELKMPVERPRHGTVFAAERSAIGWPLPPGE
ncbi:Glycosyl hydrolases family 43 [Posidoniimonas corsicana]|uniref:Glycosyl hydrolases family 43 n=1 Tax=Posidoniimonas corsicana TaxID=1938618 RepID=A0A5C5VEY5_9BACT|nr:family 43 glycosylhydrolase [Posidoniimonas corsicana]TWT36487.1 Glycosyl hydrolases family 43 [Posidoniimonas corsicana]